MALEGIRPPLANPKPVVLHVMSPINSAPSRAFPMTDWTSVDRCFVSTITDHDHMSFYRLYG